MTVLDHLVSEALRNQPGLTPLRVVVEKELLHHDILRGMSEMGLLRRLSFIGGTCLRLCYGSVRLSEDLDFSGGVDFSVADLNAFPEFLTTMLYGKYHLKVDVSEPRKESGNVDTWKIRIVTRPDRPDLPAQRVNLDIFSVPSHDRRPMMLRNPYGIDMGTSALILQAESLSEINADKIIALALRPGRIKNRDLWDLLWLRQQGVPVSPSLLRTKISDRGLSTGAFGNRLKARLSDLHSDGTLHTAFVTEMSRFLPPEYHGSTLGKSEYWQYLQDQISSICAGSLQLLE